ncbi:MAG: hypothetical protein HQM15_11310 [Deltaproteobacteria bacterium]|nr:hypothetical protein [Deltaproteobacteria bacterium]
MGFLNKKSWVGLLLLLPFLLANKQCERDITWGDVSKDLVAPWAEDHKNIDKETRCIDCHDDIKSANSRPKNHQGPWMKTHGSFLWKKYAFRSQTVCSLCHQESWCAKCHQQEPPEDHNQYWKMKGHAVVVGLDRTRCLTCHRSDFCERCHSQTQPQSHTAGWGAPSQLHCLNCHFPVQSAGAQTCNACHSSTPSHTAGTPTPPHNPIHVPSAPCRDCHLPTLHHPDNGMACTTCHVI